MNSLDARIAHYRELIEKTPQVDWSGLVALLDRIDTIARERDENKRAFDEVSKQLGILMTIRDRQYEEAEARGYRRGVRMAANAVRDAEIFSKDCNGTRQEAIANILALLEQKPR